MNSSYIFKALLLCLSLTALVSCGEDLNKADYDKAVNAAALPTVVTGDVTVYGVAAEATMTVTPAEGTTVLEQGFIVAQKPDAALADSTNKIIYVTAEPATPATAAITELAVGETYYVKAFAHVDGGIAYGETKTITATGDYERVTDYATDFTDMDGADIDHFTTVKLGNTVNPFTPVSLSIVGLNQWGFSGSAIAPSLFTTGSASIASRDENNLLSFKADLTGKAFSAVTVEGLNMAAIFGSNYPTKPGDFEVLVSAEPITDEAGLAAATVIGKSKFSTDPQDATFEFFTVTGEIPISYTGTCYITVHNHSVYGTAADNLGVIITGFSLNSLHKKAN